jgi:hypothetical protein
MTAQNERLDDNKTWINDATTIGVAAATIGGVLMGYGASEHRGPHSPIWANSWFVCGFAAVALGVVLVALSLVMMTIRGMRLSWPGFPPRRMLRSGTSEAPMKSSVLDEEWLSVGSTICVFALKIALINVTERSINLTQCRLRSNRGATSLRNLTVSDETLNAVQSSIAQMTRKHEAELLSAPVTVPALTTVSGWLVTWGVMPPPGLGRPACVFIALDDLGNTYEHEISARPPRRFRSG